MPLRLWFVHCSAPAALYAAVPFPVLLFADLPQAYGSQEKNTGLHAFATIHSKTVVLPVCHRTLPLFKCPLNACVAGLGRLYRFAGFSGGRLFLPMRLSHCDGHSNSARALACCANTCSLRVLT